MMNTSLTESCRDVFVEFKEQAESMNLDYMKRILSENLQAWEVRETEVETFGYAGAVEGWSQAFEHFRGQDVEWVYTEENVIPTAEDKFVAVYWISLIIEGKRTTTAHLYCTTFEKEEEGWKIVREYIEADQPNPLLEKE